MKPLRKALLVVAAVLLVLVGSTGLWLAFFFQPNDYRDVFSNYVYRQTGRELTINGEVRFSLGWGADGRLQIQIAAERLKLFNRAYLTDRPVGTTGWLELEIRLWPLLNGHWSIANAVVERPQINLVRLANGRSNWEDLALLGLLPVEHVQGYGGRLTWTDRLLEQTVTLTGIDWQVKPVSEGKTADIEVTFRTPSSVVGRPLSVRLAARIPRARDAGAIFPFQRLAADIAGSGLVATVQLLDGTIDLTGGLFGAATSEFTLAVPGAEARFQSQDLEYRLDQGVVRMAGLSGEGYVGRLAPLFSAATAQFDLVHGAFEIPVLDVRWLGNQAVLELKGRTLYGEPRIQGRIRASELKLEKILQWSGLEWEKPVGSPPAILSVSAQFMADSEGVSIDKLDLSIDEHHVNGRVRLDLRPEPAWSFDLRSEHLYLRPSARILAPDGSPVALLLSLPLGFPGKVDARGNLDIGELRVGDLTASRVEAKVHSVGRLLAVSPLTAQFYDGEARVELVLDRQKEAPVLLVQAMLTGFDPGGVVRDLTQMDVMSGQANVSMDLAVTQPGGPDPVNRAIGVAQAELNNAGLHGAALNGLIRVLRGAGAVVPDLIMVAPQSSATVVIDNGVARNTDLRISGPGLWVDGQGQVSLKDQTIDYLLTIGLESAKGSSKEQEPRVVDRFLPLRLSGPLASPRLTIDVAELIRRKIETEVTGLQPKRAEPATDSRSLRFQRRLRQQMQRALLELEP